MELQSLSLLIAETSNFSSDVLNEARKTFGKVVFKEIDVGDLPTSLESYDIFWFRLGYRITSDVLPTSEGVKIIASPVTGIDHIDEDACKQRGIKVVSLRGERKFLKEVRATAEFTIGLTLALIRKITWSSLDTIAGNWNRDEFRGREIYGSRVGVIGYGRLGKIVAKYFDMLGATVYINDIQDCQNAPYQHLSLQELFETCNIISIHVSYGPENHHLIGSSLLETTRGGTFLINTSRGNVIDEEALLEVIKEGKIAGAALDVIDNESNYGIDNPLAVYARDHSNLLVTPHLGGNTLESFEKTEKFLLNSIVRMAETL